MKDGSITVPAIVTEGFDIEHNGDDEEGEESNHVSPNVARFGVDAKYRLEALCEGLQLRPVAKVEVFVVFHPVWQGHKVTRFPTFQLGHCRRHDCRRLLGQDVRLVGQAVSHLGASLHQGRGLGRRLLLHARHQPLDHMVDLKHMNTDIELKRFIFY